MAVAAYWKCPICLRRVPDRVAECYCGRKRQVGDGPEPAEGDGRRRPVLGWLVAALCAAGIAAWALKPPPSPPPVAPQSTAPTPEPRGLLSGETIPRATPPPAWPDATPTPALPPVTAAVQAPPPKPSATPSDSADAQRERGAAAFEAATKNLAGRLTVLRGELRHYNEVCPREATLIVGCDTARREIQQMAQDIRAALDAAEEDARRSWVDPGVQRSIRERSGMDDVAVGETLAAAAGAAER
jgi:hypothetical protein